MTVNSGNAKSDAGAGHVESSNKSSLKVVKAGSVWLLVIAVLSIVNPVMVEIRMPIRFSLGLWVTELVYEVGRRSGLICYVIGMCIDAIIVLFLGLLGYLARKRSFVALIVGITVIGGDTILMAWSNGWDGLLGIGFHVWAVVALVRSAIAVRVLEARGSVQGGHVEGQ